jgi:hypothetical protein
MWSNSLHYVLWGLYELKINIRQGQISQSVTKLNKIRMEENLPNLVCQSESNQEREAMKV